MEEMLKTFLQNTAATLYLMTQQLTEKQILLVFKLCALRQFEEALGAVPEVHRVVHLCPEYSGCTSFRRLEKFLPQDEIKKYFA